MAQYRIDTRSFDETTKSRYESVMIASQTHPFGTQTDAFGRVRVGNPFTLFDSQQRFDLRSDQWSVANTTGGTYAHLTNQSSLSMNVNTTSGAQVIRETKRVFPYQPGKSLQAMMTFVMNAPKENLRQRVGYFGANNGIYFEMDGVQLNIVKRSYVTGSIVETRIPQSQWNSDTLDGTGRTRITLDSSKAQIFFVDVEWLGVGSVRTGFVIDGTFVVTHVFNHANIVDSVYMTTATLPVRYEITNTGTTASSSTLKQICSTVLSEGGYQGRTVEDSVSRATTSAAMVDLGAEGTLVPMISIRLNSSRLDAIVLPTQISALVASNAQIQYKLVLNPTLTGATFAATHARGTVDYDIAATAMSGGSVIKSGYINAGGTITLDGIDNLNFQLGRTLAGVSDVLTLAASGYSNNVKVAATLGWEQLV